LCLRILPNRADAEEVLHDVFCEAWGAVTQFDPARGNVIAWLLVRVRSRALDRRARLRREPNLPLPDDARAGTQPTTERQVALRQALGQLEPVLLRTLELTYFEGLTSPEVARLMGIPEGTVKSRLARGVAALQHFFGVEPSEEQP
jgi:RNA polymerase sigma-70 factor, ECF subfamily